MDANSNGVFNCFHFAYIQKLNIFSPDLLFFSLLYFQVYTDEILLTIVPVFSEDKTFPYETTLFFIILFCLIFLYVYRCVCSRFIYLKTKVTRKLLW